MAEIEQRVPECQSYLPGHTVHYIQAREAWRHPEHRRGGTVRSIAGRVVEFVSDDGEMFDLVTHDPDHVGRLVAELGSRAVYDPRWGLLRFEEPAGARLISVSTDPEIGPCSDEERGGTLTRPREDEGPEEFAARVHAALTGELRNG
jgi:hypothetical protein